MAIINCPECERQVSSKAVNCPNCGYPISQNDTSGTIRIKILQSLMGTVRILKLKDRTELWSGHGGAVAEFKITEPTEIGFIWGLFTSRKAKPTLPIIVSCENGGRYAIKNQQSVKQPIVIVPVDVIDSD